VTPAGIAANIRRLRVERHLSQDDLAHRLGVSQAHISHIERGKRPVRDPERFAEALGADAEELLVPALYRARRSLCGRVMCRYRDNAGPGAVPVCGRPAGHGGRCESEAARERRRAVRRQRYREQVAEEMAA
jgi:transcriptional regulator with XRE-family HTH domain